MTDDHAGLGLAAIAATVAARMTDRRSAIAIGVVEGIARPDSLTRVWCAVGVAGVTRQGVTRW